MAVFLRSVPFARLFSSTPLSLPHGTQELALPSTDEAAKENEGARSRARVECILKRIDAELTRSSFLFKLAVDSECWELAELIEKFPELRGLLPARLARYVDNFSEGETKGTKEFYDLTFDLDESEG
jgi:hypothetical protein